MQVSYVTKLPWSLSRVSEEVEEGGKGFFSAVLLQIIGIQIAACNGLRNTRFLNISNSDVNI
jgi:hypothetical protein